METLKTLKKVQLRKILSLHPEFKKIPSSWSKQKIIDKMIEYDVHYKVPMLDPMENYSIAFLKIKSKEIDPNCNLKTKKKLIEFIKNKKTRDENEVIEKLYECVTNTEAVDITMDEMVEILF
jgi:hypothetical protein